MDDLCWERDEGTNPLLVLLDLSAAFNTNDHGILLGLLARNGISSLVLQPFHSWVNSYGGTLFIPMQDTAMLRTSPIQRLWGRPLADDTQCIFLPMAKMQMSWKMDLEAVKISIMQLKIKLASVYNSDDPRTWEMLLDSLLAWFQKQVEAEWEKVYCAKLCFIHQLGPYLGQELMT